MLTLKGEGFLGLEHYWRWKEFTDECSETEC